MGEKVQNLLLEIVKSWQIPQLPEYRGFRCANCQRYIFKAWHYLLNKNEYLTPVHFCKNCQRKFNLRGGIYKKFTCDKCKKQIRKAWHIWKRKGNTLTEIHLCKKCFKLKA